MIKVPASNVWKYLVEEYFAILAANPQYSIYEWVNHEYNGTSKPVYNGSWSNNTDFEFENDEDAIVFKLKFL